MQDTTSEQQKSATEKVDEFQARYLKHQERKRQSLTTDYGEEKFRVYNEKEQQTFFDILKSRCSQRMFNGKKVGSEVFTRLLEAIRTSPSSCGRNGIGIAIIEDRDRKDLLSGILVGGTNWINRADVILLLFADMNCYKSPAEKDFMPYLDAGVIAQTTYLASEALNLGCCFVNPNIREENKAFFKERFAARDNLLFCGALAIGLYDKKHTHK